MTLALEADIVDDDAFADAGDDVLQDTPAGFVEEHVVGGNGGDPHAGGEIAEVVQPQMIAWPPAQDQRQKAVGAENRVGAPQPRRGQRIGLVRNKDGDHPLVPGIDILPVQVAAALACPRLT